MTEIPNSRTGSMPGWLRKLLGRDDAAAAARPAAHPAIEADALDRLKVADVMVPRADIVAVELGTPLGELAALFAEASHSRLPVFRETLDDPVSIVHIKDVVSRLTPDANGQLAEQWAEAEVLPEIGRPLLFAPPSMRATALLRRMQARRQHMALVVDVPNSLSNTSATCCSA